MSGLDVKTTHQLDQVSGANRKLAAVLKSFHKGLRDEGFGRIAALTLTCQYLTLVFTKGRR